MEGASRSVPIDHGWKWIIDGFNLVKKSIGIWIVLTLIFMIGAMIISIIPFIGPFAFFIIYPVLVGGLMLGCKALDEDRELLIDHLFAGFQKHTKPLIILGILHLIAVFVIVGIATALQYILPNPINPLLTILIPCILYIPIWMGFWFAPVLITLDNTQVFCAIKQSFLACLKNIMPFVIYGIMGLVEILMTITPLLVITFLKIPSLFSLLFAIILFPTAFLLTLILLAAIYTSYRDIFKTGPI